jgi:hypothetical protein
MFPIVTMAMFPIVTMPMFFPRRYEPGRKGTLQHARLMRHDAGRVEVSDAVYCQRGHQRNLSAANAVAMSNSKSKSRYNREAICEPTGQSACGG